VQAKLPGISVPGRHALGPVARLLPLHHEHREAAGGPARRFGRAERGMPQSASLRANIPVGEHPRWRTSLVAKEDAMTEPRHDDVERDAGSRAGAETAAPVDPAGGDAGARRRRLRGGG